jgi:hypothetical protein
MYRQACFLLVAVVLGTLSLALVPAASADVIYTLNVTEEPDFGPYSWTIIQPGDTPSFFTATIFDSGQSPAGTTINFIEVYSGINGRFGIETDWDPPISQYDASGEVFIQNGPFGFGTWTRNVPGIIQMQFTVTSSNAQVPEPSSLMLWATSLLGLPLLLRRFTRR